VSPRRRGVSAPPATAADSASSRKLKIGAIKFWGLEVGPFELPWPPRIGRMRAIALATVVIALALLLPALIYVVKVRPTLNDARDAMRRGDYQRAESLLSGLNPKLQSWPSISAATEQARFGARLGKEDIRTLPDELERLRARDPNGANVLVFQGLNAYYADGEIGRAIEFFARAAENDPKHIEAHVLAAGRRVDRAYDALLRGNELAARDDLVEGAALLDRLDRAVAFSRGLPRVANQRAELHELRGAVEEAYTTYARLAATDVLAAVQAAMVSWRLADPGSRVQAGLELAQSALARIERRLTPSEVASGWSFRVSGTQTIIVREEEDKKCLTSQIADISQALVTAYEWPLGAPKAGESPLRKPEPPSSSFSGADAPNYCPRTTARGLVRDVVCLQVLAALAVRESTDTPRRRTLETWRTDRLRCGINLKAPPVLPPGRPQAFLISG
jgi:tetratricopeptide (TPR) repeat protein